jgi:drug/metabolite transporter (DMT)-like permease
MTPKSERKGEVYALALSVLEGLFPILSLITVTALGAVTAYLYTIVIATLFFLLLLFHKNKSAELLRFDAYKELLLTSLFITLLFVSIFISLKYTTPANVAVIMILQLFFSYFYFHIIGSEKMEPLHTLGAFIMGIGAIIILFPADFKINTGDLFVLFASAIAPIANLYQKRSREKVSSITIMTFRNLVAIPFLIALAYTLEMPSNPFESLHVSIILILNAVLVFVIAKILWVEALYHISITKLSALVTLIPIFTVGFSYIFLGDIPSLRQVLGMAPIIIGALMITRK